MVDPLSPRTLVYGVTTSGEPRVSPNGRHLVYALGHPDAEADRVRSELWVCEVDGQAAHRLLPGRSASHAQPEWAPDGRSIAFVDEDAGTSVLAVLPVDGGYACGEVRELASHRSAIGGLAWSPEGRRLTYTTLVDPAGLPRRPDVRVTRRLDYQQDGSGYLGDAREQVHLVEAAGGASPRVLTRTVADHIGPRWSPDGRTLALAVFTDAGERSRLGLLSVETLEIEEVEAGYAQLYAWAWSGSGDRIVFAADPVPRTWQPDFYVYYRASHSVRCLTADLQPWLPWAWKFGSSPQPVWLDDHRVLFYGIQRGASGLYVLDVETGAVELEHAAPSRNGGLSVDAARRFVAQTCASPGGPAELIVRDRAVNASHVVTAHNQVVRQQHPPARVETFQVERGGFSLDCWLLLPPDFDPSRSYPLVLDVHGGPNNHHGYQWRAHQQCLATHGFGVLAANPRGSSTYGRDFTRQIIEDWGGEDFLDLMACVDTVLERPYLDADRTGIYGHSYGGYMAAWSIGQTNRFRAAVCGAPVFDFVSFYGTSDIGPVFARRHWGGPPHERQAFYAARSPATFAHRARTPTLIVQGEADHCCPVGQAEQMFVALAEAGCETELVRYPGGSHSVIDQGPLSTRVDYLERVLAWFERYLT